VSLGQDLEYGVRILTKQRGFTAAAVTLLALGLGTSMAMFTIVDAVLIRPLPYESPERLVKVTTNATNPSDDMAVPDYLDLRAQNQAFQSVAADDGSGFVVRHQDLTENVNGAMVTAEWLTTLGVQPMLGRGFLPEEMQPGRDRVLVLTHAYWVRRFQRDPTVVGRVLSVDGDRFTIVGVLPPNVLRYDADLLKPLVLSDYPADRSRRGFDVIARLRPSVTRAQAEAEVETIARRLEQAYPETNRGRAFTLVPLDSYYVSIQAKAPQGLRLMLGAVAVLLLIACVNVANLLLLRGMARSRECTIRSALGASRRRLVRQLLTENLLLFCAGGVIGLVLARALVGVMVAFGVSQGYLPPRLIVSLDVRAIAAGTVLSIVMALTFGLVVALRGSRVDLNADLRDSAAAATGGPRRRTGTKALVVAQLSLSLVLFVGFALLLRSFLEVNAASPGFAPERLLVTAADGGRVFDPAVAFWRSALDQAYAILGVEHAAVTSRPPIHGARRQAFVVEGRAPSPGGVVARAGDILVSPDYFQTLGIPLLQGRAFTDRDDAAALPVAIVSETLARHHFGDADPIGQRLIVQDGAQMTCCAAPGPVVGVARQIVGVVGDVRQGNLDEEPAATIYRPYTQIVEHDMYLLVRTRSEAQVAGVSSLLRDRLEEAAGTAGRRPGEERWLAPRSMTHVIAGSDSIRLRRFVLVLLGSFASLALVLAAVGLYSVVAYSVAQRRREIGIRVALGAQRRAILIAIVKESLVLSAASLAAGVLAAFAGSRLLASMLFRVTAADPVAYLAGTGVLLAVALLASYLPARRAAGLDPAVVLRER